LKGLLLCVHICMAMIAPLCVCSCEPDIAHV